VIEAICRNASAMVLVWAAMSIAARAQTFETLLSFNGSNGVSPQYMAMVQGVDGNFYGTVERGGHSYGTVFRVTPDGILTTLYSFCAQNNCPDGASPYAGLVQGTDGNFYGTTYEGGANDYGTVFKITSQGVLTTIYSFCAQTNCSDGSTPYGGLVQATDGNFYGTTLAGGTVSTLCPLGCGTVFRLTIGGVLTTLHTFCLQAYCDDGSAPASALVQATDGSFYGTTTSGGQNDVGTIFKLTASGLLTTLHSFGNADGINPYSALVQGLDHALYGTTLAGGSRDAGTVFRITTAGVLTTLHSFAGSDGIEPLGGLVQGTDRNLYGTTVVGGANNYGTLFKITTAGVLTTLYNFCSQNGCNDGSFPQAGLVQSTNGNFYGTTENGGDICSCGTIFSLSTNLSPFLGFVRSSGYVAQTGPILGQGFTGTTNVSLNGTSISFTVKSDTLITATIPAGGTTGPVTVTTPTGTLTSNVPFRVLPQLLSFTPTSGPVGTQVTITGVSLTQTTGVGFGDYTPAQFTVNSDTQVTATVPTGAQTGPVGIQTQGGIAISTQTFTVTQ